ncbi:hypothetical protein NE235_16905 [Actinoallomurus spadix]|uniref:hypothetical protein n=1 Tax=Actinoallomurus spadix TaxID=79912 RepID=UPI0020921FF5|nr:hypothetical protein [Actinoallomurus spadix]MCO5987781.1 hypothetical protein [Actinoallomurus spadix]
MMVEQAPTPRTSVPRVFDAHGTRTLGTDVRRGDRCRVVQRALLLLLSSLTRHLIRAAERDATSA